MNPIAFMNTIYLGDRSCTKIEVDSVRNEIRLGIDLISRVRGEGLDFYSAEDVLGECIVFERISYFEINQAGPLPNA